MFGVYAVVDGGGRVEKMTRVDGKGLWRSWKRNFKTKLLALLDLIDNALDAGIHGLGNGDHNAFVGRVHVYPDVYEVLTGPANVSATTTGLCIVNNCVKKIRPLKKVLEVYNSSKVDSGAGDIGENGVGLKQGCATLSDLSFVLLKNGNNANIELGIVAESLQQEEGCYLPAFQFSNERGGGSPSLRDQMISHFSQPKHADVACCIAQYGAASSGNDPNLGVGVERLCRHFDHICYNFFDDPYMFLVILDKVHHGHSEEYVQNAWDAQQKITVHQLMKDLGKEIPRTYLHIPNSFDFTIGGGKTEFKFWPERLIELASFTLNINAKIPWHQKFGEAQYDANHPDSYELRVFIGFDGMRITDPSADTDPSAGKEGSLYIYSRQSGRLISHHPDARTLLGLSAGGTMFCQGLTVIIDDIGGNLPLNPTKQEVAFGEEGHGATHQENLMAWVGSVVHFFYQFHLGKCQNKKTALTRKIAKFGDIVLQKHRQLKTLDSSCLTTFSLSFKSTGKSIRVEKGSVKELVGTDTLYRLGADRSRTAPKRTRSLASSSANQKKRKATKNDEVQTPIPPTKIPRRRQPVSDREAESEPDGENEETTHKVRQCRQPVLYHEAESESDGEIEEREIESDDEIEEGEIEETRVKDGKIDEDNPNAPAGGQIKNDDEGSDPYTKDFYRDLCDRLTQKTNAQKVLIKSLKQELAKEESLRNSTQQQILALQKKINSLEKLTG
eukprot:CAMPEP_0172578222 /NCGR_PEP_ID=MMETSP1067-20121228/138625_1 /TAXON_ID=265564 ORGANISM="Thalassiosira punctigera, Strain Tpunct2005C2" /NCGR_SAMPLE_ID=MMETSP1067 /ASSEMBLY_ACC=CAM_ASM_000444 /LENGTH=726 /DNA_ID=CAMNT_0013370913 /DNA_START=415 /DNA_END=2596 /DNA_ORIENTATION=+